MIRTVLAAILITPAFSLAFAQESVVSPVKEVTVYTSGAMVTREGSAKIGKGIQELLVEVQAFSLDKDSLTARIFGEGEVQGVEYREIPVAEPPQEGVKRLEEKVTKLKSSKRRLADEREVLDKKELFLTSLIKSSGVPDKPEAKIALPKVQELEQMLAFLGASFKNINENREPLDERLEELERQIAAAQAELDAIKGSDQKKRKVIDVTFDSRKEQTVRIETAYLVPRASWHPLYKAAVSPDLKAADLTMFSTIGQVSGEDWKDVALSISNVVPLRGGYLPVLSTWFLDVARPVRMMKSKAEYAPAPAPAAAPALAQELAAPEEKAEAGLAFATAGETPLSMEYRFPGRVTVESGDRETNLPLFSRPLQGDFFYYAVPRVNGMTFLVCGAKADKEMLAGPMNAYFAGRFVGKTFVAEKRVGEDFRLNLGADRAVKVRRETIRDKVKETSWGFDKKNVVRDLAYRIAIENLKEVPVRIKVVDAVPISKTDRIEVKDLKVLPAPSDKSFEGKEGVYSWDLDVKAGEHREITVEFTVTFPKDEPPAGL